MTVTHEASIGESLNITCTVLAYPNDLTYFWTTDGQTENSLSTFTFSPTKLTNVMRLEIKSDQDFQKYICKAKNKIGLQKDGCTFVIIPKGTR